MCAGAAKMATQAIPPPPQEAELSPKSADSGGVTSSPHVTEVPQYANRTPSKPTGRYVDAKEVT
jgi:hypothetical protein